MEQRIVPYKNSTISYYRFGAGSQKVICFHGYGEDASTFSFLAHYAGNQFSFYSIDLPFHGKTAWKDGLNFSMADLSAIVQLIIDEGGAEPPAVNSKLYLLGFSLGGRVALSYTEANPEKVARLVLLAPDGLKVNFWYGLATQTWLGNRLFQFIMKNPSFFVVVLKLFNKLRLVNTSIFKFVKYYIGDASVRDLLYKRWTTLRKLKPQLSIIKANIRNNNIPVRLVYGKHDRIILSSVGEKFKKGIEEQCTLQVIAAGHQVLSEKYVAEIIDSLSELLNTKNL